MDDHRPDVPRSIPDWVEYVFLLAVVVVVVIAAIVLLVPQQASIFNQVNNSIPYPYVTPTPAPYP